MMQQRAFGKTGFTTSALGFGAGHIGGHQMSEDDAASILNAALDLGISFIDTARGYGLSEERIGRHIAHRRSEYVLATKGGYGVDGVPDWTPECIIRGVDNALARLRTDHVDIMLFHSCQMDVLRRDELIEALESAVQAGKVRVAAYSGENEELKYAAECGRFKALETSVNLFDEWSLRHVLPGAAERGIGVIAKRPIANAPWKHTDRPHGNYCETYWERMHETGIKAPDGMPWNEFALRFSAFAPGVSTAIVGTGNMENLKSNVSAVEKGPLPEELVKEIYAKYDAYDGKYRGQV